MRRTGVHVSFTATRVLAGGLVPEGSHRAVTRGGVADVPNACASLYPLTAILPFHTWPSTSGLLPANRGECAATSCLVPGPVARAHGGSGGHDDRATAVPTGRQCSSGCFGVLPRHLTAAAGPAHLDPPVHRPVLPFGDSHVPSTLGCRPTRGPCPAAAPPETRETTVLEPQSRLAAAQSSRRAATSSTG
jgi:hypothetical protein